MRRILGLALGLIFTLSANSATFDHMIFLGDSLSDTGNLYGYTLHFIPKSPPYYQGHFSNGKVWSEYLHEHFFPKHEDLAERNYAVGGAAAYVSLGNTMPYSLSTEVNDYLYFHNYKDKSSTLFVIWVGANNYILAPEDKETSTTKSVEAIVTNIKSLIEAGGQFFFVPNLPDLGQIPFAKSKQKEQEMSTLSLMHNQKLKLKLAELRQEYPKAHIVEFDVAPIFADVLAHPEKYDITNVVDNCYSGEVFFNQPTEQDLANYVDRQSKQHGLSLTANQKQTWLTNPALHEAIRVGYLSQFYPKDDLNCEGYFFWDNIHPTSFVHKKIAEFAITEIENAGLSSAS